MSTPNNPQKMPPALRGLVRAAIPFLALAAAAPSPAQWAYPPARRTDVVDTYFGRSYPDPYRWLESLKSPGVEAWFKAQAELTDKTLARIPAREALVREWAALDKLKPAAYTGIVWENGRVFYKKTLGGENVGKIYYRNGWTGAERLLFDPTTYRKGVTTTVETMIPSPDGRHVVMGFSAGGAEFSELRVVDVDAGALLPERIYPSYGPTGWTPDGRSFLYDAGKVTDIKSLQIELNRKTRIHVLGAPVAGDVDFFSNESCPDLGITPKEFPQAAIDESYPDYVVGDVGTVQNEMRRFYAPRSEMGSGKVHWSVLCQRSDNLVRGMEFMGDSVYAITHSGAPHYRVVATAVAHPDWTHARTVVPEAGDSIQEMVKCRHYLVLAYSNGIVGRLVRFDPATGSSTDLALPAGGIVVASCPDWRSDHCLVSIASWTFPKTLYDLDVATGTFTKSIFNTAIQYPGFDKLVSEEVEVKGHDGAMVPLSIIRLKDLPLDGSASCILEGYGAYGISYPPHFSILHSIALHGVVVAYAHVRGGSEKGEAWYRAGYKATKPNTWKDFISCAEYLVGRRYTSPAHLAGIGTSAGGILITRAITERPDLFAAAVCNVGCANALRLEFSSNGPVNIPEFGTVKDKAECAALAEMDGLAHVRKGVAYPAVMGVGGWNDPRVPIWQPGKFVAAVQWASVSGRPALMKVNFDDGHFTEDKMVTFRNFAGQDAFMLWQTGNPEFQPGAAH
jgi:prolyl oligopeptidase